MLSVRKRKMMIKKLNAYFVKRKRVVSEREYSTDPTAPYRLTMITKYLGGWSRMLVYLGFYYPQWKESEVKVKTFTIEKKDEKDL